MVTIEPAPYDGPMKNPLKGFRTDLPAPFGGSGKGLHNELLSVTRHYIRWFELENHESDGLDKIRAFCDHHWADLARCNTKVIPLVFLYWPPGHNFWPSDLDYWDYGSPRFLARVERLIQRMAQVWDNDPRVLYVRTGLVGPCGEQWNPTPPPELMKVMGDTYTACFRNKLCMNRYPWQFRDYRFGTYWDSWCCHKDTARTLGELETPRMAGRWKTAVMGGEIPYGFGHPPGKDPNDSLSDPYHVAWIECLTRRIHQNCLGWVSEYDQTIPQVMAGAERVQKALGYRFELQQVRYTGRVEPGGALEVELAVRNVGSSPFYYNWPVEVSLLDPATRQAAWRGTFEDLDIRTWLPGDHWMQWAAWDDAHKHYVLDDGPARYALAPKTYTAQGRFLLPASLGRGRYILSLAILDPAGMLPSARFATANYYAGGRHPIGLVGLGQDVDSPRLDPREFTDPRKDDSLHYVV
jgi:hypothetical protein